MRRIEWCICGRTPEVHEIVDFGRSPFTNVNKAVAMFVVVLVSTSHHGMARYLINR